MQGVPFILCRPRGKRLEGRGTVGHCKPRPPEGSKKEIIYPNVEPYTTKRYLIHPRAESFELHVHYLTYRRLRSSRVPQSVVYPMQASGVSNVYPVFQR